MDPPPPSQSQATPKTTLFSNPDGTPIRVFIQADLFGRSKVVKRLRINGAELLSNANDAQVMLVDPPSRQGQQFIRDWGKDDNKTVLNFAWANRCVDAGRPLLAGDQWGNCLAVDDGRPIDAGEGVDDVELEAPPKSPLPTPRVTPEERARMRSKKSTSRPPSVSLKSQADEMSVPALNTPATSNRPVSATPDNPPSAAAVSPMAGMNPFLFMQNPAAMNVQNPAMQNPAAMNMLAQATQAMMATMLMNVSANMIPNQQQPFANNPFMLALQDSMRNHAVPSWPGMQPQNGSFHASQPVSPLSEPPVPYPSAPSNSKKPESSEPPSPTFMSEPSGSRRASSVSERKGKKKERTPSPAAKRRKVSSSSAKDIEMEHTPQAGPSNLFKTKSGRSLSFFVQIEIHNRFTLVSSIKKNGGMIVDTPESADYAILYAGNQKQKVFKTLLHAAQSADVPAVQAKFLHACLSKKKLLDPTDYLYEPELKRKRKRSVSRASVESEDEDEVHESEIDEAERKRLAKNARQAERRRRMKEEEAKSKATPTNTPKQTSRRADYPKATDGPRTPSPPPEGAREICPQGFKFSRAEDDFALRFAKVMIDRDYTVSQSAVTSAIHKKLPHHTLLSWRSHFSGIASEWDTWRKRSAIAHRKAQLMRQAASGSAESMEGMEVEVAPPVAPVPSGSESQNADDLEDDIKAVVRFFAEGNDRDMSEDESVVWQRLAAEAPCKTESSWEIFYEKHSQVVIERYNAAID